MINHSDHRDHRERRLHFSAVSLLSVVQNPLRCAVLTGAAMSALAGSRASANAETAASSDAFVDTMGVNIHAGHYLGYGGVAYNNWDGIINAVGDIGFRYVRDHSLEYQRLNQLSAATGAKVIAISEWQDSSKIGRASCRE